jgi:hypothetical protein
MDLKIEAGKIIVNPFSRGGRILVSIDAKNIDNIDEIAASIVKECDPAYLVTLGNRAELLGSIGIEYVMDYFGLVQQKEDYGMKNEDF